MNVYIISGSVQYAEMFLRNKFTVVANIDDAELVCFTGGEDVNPALYGEDRHPKTHCNPKRDENESLLFKMLKEKQIPMVGICRGGQFLNVMNGGMMFQHVTGHTENHEVTDIETGQLIYCSSTHHQMMRPSKDAKIVAVTPTRGLKEYMSSLYISTLIRKENDIEVLWYEDTKCLCFQPHPEFHSPIYQNCEKYFFDLIKRYISKGN